MSVVSSTNHNAIVWHDTSIVYFDDNDVPGEGHIDSADLPDLTDPATLGCLLHLVREYWGDGGAYTRRFCRYGGGEKWLCCAPSVVYPAVQTHGATEAEALVKALEMEIPND